MTGVLPPPVQDPEGHHGPNPGTVNIMSDEELAAQLEAEERVSVKALLKVLSLIQSGSCCGLSSN